MERNLRTIVGGRSAAYRELGNFPRGIEVLLKKAKVDPAFREQFLENPVTAADGIDLHLTDSEKKVLTTTPKNLLETMIGNTFVPRHHVATFLKAGSAAMLALVLGTSVIIPTYAAGQGERIEDAQAYHAELAQARMASIQTALEQYRLNHGSYPTTEAWLRESNPLDGYIALMDLQDPWKRRFHYEEVVNEAGKVVNYLLESLGLDVEDPADNIPCPTDPELHKFYGDNSK